MANKPLPRRQRVENRGYQYSRKEQDKTKNILVTLKDVDSAILYYFENVIKLSVKENGENIKVPILYGSVERWKAILRDGYLRDKKRQIITPVIVFKRNTISLNEMIPQDKLDANNPHLFYPFKKKYSQVNKYDNLTTQIGAVPQKEYYNVTFPDYVSLSYSFIIWTTYIEQMNRIVERVNYADGAYWGDPDKMRFKSIIESFDDATEMTDAERLIRTNFDVTINGYILLEKSLENKPTTEKFITPRTLKFVNETVIDILT
jgi:hypothetical protein